jgi:uncharacterized protein (DUF427 family)
MKLLRSTRVTVAARAVWDGAVLAETAEAVVVEGNPYFPREDVRWELLEPSNKQTVCPWKGEASYYSVVVDGKRNEDAAWSYPDPSRAAGKIRRRIAFWNGVQIETGGEQR